MRVTFFSNYMVLHQLPFSLEMLKLGLDYKFVACEPIEQERLDMHYKDLNNQYDYIIRSYEDEVQDKTAEQLAVQSDVVIFGSGDIKYLRKRLAETNKLTFFCTERILKKGTYRRFIPITYNKIKRNYLQYKYKNFYILCNSAYTSYDLSLCGFPDKKCFKFGYFPETIKYDLSELMKKKKQGEIIWVGRFMKLKHPEFPVIVANKLKKEKIKFHLTMIGDGAEMSKIKQYISRNHLEKYVTLTGSIPNDQVRKNMEEASIFIMTSNFREGWGAVLNEAMNSGCACISSHAVGAAPYLIEDRKNGLLYKNGNINDLYKKIKLLLLDDEKRSEYGRRAYETILNEWNSEVAAKRVVDLSSKLISQDEKLMLCNSGILSNAQKLKNGWYKK